MCELSYQGQVFNCLFESHETKQTNRVSIEIQASNLAINFYPSLDNYDYCWHLQLSVCLFIHLSVCSYELACPWQNSERNIFQIFLYLVEIVYLVIKGTEEFFCV